jgi:hypothetical protein
VAGLSGVLDWFISKSQVKSLAGLKQTNKELRRAIPDDQTAKFKSKAKLVKRYASREVSETLCAGRFRPLNHVLSSNRIANRILASHKARGSFHRSSVALLQVNITALWLPHHSANCHV